MDSYGVRRKDTTKGPPLRVLSLDGGGVRGYSMLIIIQELMHRTFVEIEGRAPHRHEIPKPCDHFDLIVGTGTGGLIAIMLGRLRLDIEKCKELYVRMTRMVFETDKTIAGIPIRSTLFKASRLEEAIKQVVWEHTVYEKEGNDRGEPDAISPLSCAGTPRRHSSNASVLSFSARNPHGHAHVGRPVLSSRYGNGNASLYDARESRTKTVVTAMYKGSGKGAAPVLLRSYDSRREPPPESNCKIWQAGRATCAIGLAFKPIQIGQSIFHDDAYGSFNPAPEALDEAVVNEWPGREVGVFVSVGTGKRPRGSDANQHIWYEGFFSDFADARRKLIAKIEGCEKIHEYMVREHLVKRGVNVERYYRLNVEIGVGEFGMNEWHRLGEISTSTRRYMGREDEQRMIQGISSKLAKVHRAKLRIERSHYAVPELVKTTSTSNFEHPLAVELPGDIPAPGSSFARASRGSYGPHGSPRSHSPPYPPSRGSYESGRGDSIHMRADSHSYPSPQSSHELQAPPGYHPHSSPHGPRAVSPASASASFSASATATGSFPASQDDGDQLYGAAPTPTEYRNACGVDKIAITSTDEQPQPRPLAHAPTTRIDAPFLTPDMPPPVPPKTPLGYRRSRGGSSASATLQYPLDEDEDEVPPPVNMARKPEYLM